MNVAARRACALSIAGLDPGGGAGILVDARAFVAAGAFPCAALALVTVQSTAGMRSARTIAAAEMIAQVDEVVRHQNVRAIKTGALGSAANVEAVAAWLRTHRTLPVVVDPVIAPTRSANVTRATGATGANTLLRADALAAMRDALVPLATVVTANASEASRLTGREVRSEADAKRAAATLLASGARAALVKGGHLDIRDAVDFLAIGDRVLTLRAPRLAGGARHGGGCALASLIAGRLAVRGKSDDAAIVAAVRWAKRVHHDALARSVTVGEGATVLLF